MLADARYHQLDTVRGYLSLIVYPIQWMVDAPIRLTGTVMQYASTFNQLVHENAELKHQAFLQNARLQKLLALEAENTRIRALLKSSHSEPETHRVAEIIGINSDRFEHRLILNKGAKQGVLIGEPVIDAKGVIGEVIEVRPLTSRVILLTDANYGISVENLRNGVRGIVVGTGLTNILALQHIANTVDLKVGDILVTSGLDGRYPPGYSVGHVLEIERDPSESYVNVKIKPSAELDKTREVLLVERPKEGL
jgi:rod shape-determining protein MreC